MREWVSHYAHETYRDATHFTAATNTFEKEVCCVKFREVAVGLTTPSNLLRSVRLGQYRGYTDAFEPSPPNFNISVHPPKMQFRLRCS